MSQVPAMHVVTPGYRIVEGLVVREPFIVLAPTHRMAVHWASRHGFCPQDERRGRLVLIDYGGGDRLRGTSGGTFVVVGQKAHDPQYGRWLEEMKQMLMGPCGFRELHNWDDAVDGAVREALYWAHFDRPDILGGDWAAFSRLAPSKATLSLILGYL